MSYIRSYNSVVPSFIVFIVMAIMITVLPVSVAADDENPLLTIDQLPAEVSLVISASVLNMRGEDDPETIWPVSFSSEADAGLKEPGFNYDNFLLIGAGLRDWGVSTDDPSLYSLSAMLVFADPIGRRTTVMLVADYKITDKNLDVTNAAALTMTPPAPEARIYVVPVNNFPATLLEVKTDEAEFFNTVVDRAVGAGEKAVASTPEDYYVFAFVLDRLTGDSKFQLMVGDQASGIEGVTGNSVTSDFSGWRVAVLRGVFSLGAGPEVFFKTVYTPGQSVSQNAGQASLTSVFSSHALSKKGGS